MYQLVDNVWKWVYQSSQLPHLRLDQNIYLHHANHDKVTILAVKEHDPYNLMYNYENVLNLKLVGGRMDLCHERNKYHDKNTLCDICGTVQYHCLYYTVRTSQFNVCNPCYQVLHNTKPKYINNTRFLEGYGNQEHVIDIALRYNNKVLFLWRHTYCMSKLTMMNYIYFNMQAWYMYGKEVNCNYCHKFVRQINTPSCIHCYNHTKQLWLEYVNIYMYIVDFELYDVVNIIIQNYIQVLGYNDIDINNIILIREPYIPPIINIPQILDITTSEEDLTYVLNNYEDVYGLNDTFADDELGHWSDDDNYTT